MLLSLATFLLPCHLRRSRSRGTVEILENAANASGTVWKSASFHNCTSQGMKV